MQISTHEYMELMTEHMLPACAHTGDLEKPKSFGDKCDSFFDTPSEELNDPLITLKELLQGQPSLLHCVAQSWKDNASPRLAKSVTQICLFVRRNGKRLRNVEDSKERLTDYVYPVV